MTPRSVLMISRSDMKHSAVIILMFNTLCAFANITHEIDYFVGCFVNGTTQVQFEFDAEEMLYVDFSKKEVKYTVPTFIDPDPSQILVGLSILKDAQENEGLCLLFTTFAAAAEEKILSEHKDPLEIILYPSEDVQLGVENILICFVNHFYPPIKVSWTKNGHPVSEGVSLGRYYPNKDQTFHQFSTLTFTPGKGDIYSCTVEHSALEMPKTRIWEQNFTPPSLGPDICCVVGLTLALLGFATGVYFTVKAQHEQ